MSKLIQDINLGSNLQKFRKAKGLTQDEVCAKMTLAGRPLIKTTYSQIETGARNIFVSDLIVLSEILDVDFNEIFNNLQPTNKYDIKDSE